MTQAALAVSPATAGNLAANTIVETRFGTYEFDPQASFLLPYGLPGFPESRRFGLANLPGEQMQAFKLLQSLEDGSLSFIVTPLDPSAGQIARADFEVACLSAGTTPDQAALLLLVTLRKTADGMDITVNLRAPIVLDLDRRIGRQVVLQNTAYAVRHPLTL
jgi:flagellar assembly factor FliW